jgi:HSP20 family protein
MAGLVPFNRKDRGLTRTGFGDFYGMLDDFFSDDFMMPRRSLARDTFKLDVQDKEKEYLIEAELPGVKREEKVDEEKKNYIHKERRYCSMNRSVYLADADTENIKAKLDNGVLEITVPKVEKSVSQKNKIEIE